MRIIGWKLDNGHRHTFISDSKKDPFLDELYIEHEGEICETQQDYLSCCIGMEGVLTWETYEYPYNHEGIKEAIKDGFVSIDDDPDEIEDLVRYASENGLNLV